MSEIDKEIEQNENDLSRYDKEITKRNDKISKLKQRQITLRKTGKLTKETEEKIRNEIKLNMQQKEQYEVFKDHVVEQLSKLRSELEKRKPRQKETQQNPTDIFSRLNKPSNMVQDEDVEDEYEKILKEIQREEEENRIRATQQQKKLSDREQEYESKTGKNYNPLLNTEEVEEEIFRADEEEQQKNLPDPDEYVTLSNDPPIIQSSSKTRRITPPIESISSKNKTKKIRPTPEGIELEDFKNKTPKQVPLEDFEINDEYFKEPAQEKKSSKRVPFEIEFEDSNKNTQTPKQVPLEDVEINEVYLKEPEQEKEPEKEKEPSKLLQPLGFTETLKKAKPKKPQKISENKCQYIFEDNTKYFFPSQFPNITKKRPITFALKKGGKRKTRKYIKRYKL